jgi:hypothetical protein
MAGDQVQVDVGHGLARGGAIVDTDRVPVGCELALHVGPRLVEQRQHRDLLGMLELEEGSDMASRNDQRVSGRHRICVAHDNGQGMPKNDPGGGQGAEGAGQGLQDAWSLPSRNP